MKVIPGFFEKKMSESLPLLEILQLVGPRVLMVGSQVLVVKILVPGQEYQVWVPREVLKLNRFQVVQVM